MPRPPHPVDGLTPDPATLADPFAEAALRRYWRFHVKLILALLGIGALVSVVMPLCAPRLRNVHFFAWPLPFYMGAQGAVLIYLAIVAVYVGAMRGADRRLQSLLDGRPVVPPPPSDFR